MKAWSQSGVYEGMVPERCLFCGSTVYRHSSRCSDLEEVRHWRVLLGSHVTAGVVSGNSSEHRTPIRTCQLRKVSKDYICMH